MRLLLVLLALLAFAAPAQAQSEADEPSTLTVTGRGVVQVEPDLATVGIDVRRAATGAERARSSVDRRTRQIIAGLARLEIGRTEIQTSGISLDEQRLRPLRRGGRPRVRFVAVNRLTVRTRRLGALSSLFGVATRAGATDFSGPEFSVENRTPGRAAATTAAVADARTRAEAAAAALGQRVTGVRSVVLDPADSVRTDEQAATPDSSGGSGERATPPTPVSPGTEDVAARVTVVFLLGS